MRYIIYTSFLLLIFASNLYSQNKVLVLTAECAIHPACEDYVKTGIEKAVEKSAECLVIYLNTPGGLLVSTRRIVTLILESKVPVIVYVSPGGSQAASAGVFITLAGHVAAMAPGTNIGAAHPVTLQGVQDSVMMQKATNDAAAFIRTISEKRRRNIDWAEDAVRKSLSISETEALKLNVIDIVARDLEDLLVQADGLEIEIAGEKLILDTKNSEIEYLDMTVAQQILSLLSDPNFVYILFMLGIYGLFFELYNPGAIFPGVIGAICLILAFYAMNTLPVNYAGLALIILSIILFILEVKIVSHGLLSIGGIISLLLGSMMLIDAESLLEAVEISMELIILVVVLTAAFFLFAIGMGIRAQRLKTSTGAEGLIGEIGKTVTKLAPEGEILVHGEFWKARSVEGKIEKGKDVEILIISNLIVTVKKISEENK